MDISLGELTKLSITKLKEMIKTLSKDPKNVKIIYVIKNLILDKKKIGYLVHPKFIGNRSAFIRQAKCKPVHLVNI